MILKRKIQEKIKRTIAYLQRFMDRWWYSPIVGALALLDNLILIVPTDGILISSALLKPRQWLYLAISVSVGSTIGAFLLFHLVGVHGLPWILNLYPAIDESTAWILTERFFDQYGLILVFAVAATPVMQQPAIVLASLSQTSLFYFLLAVFFGRLMKYFIMAYIASHAPRLLSKMWGIRTEMEEVGIQVNAQIKHPTKESVPTNEPSPSDSSPKAQK
ncbi:YqaA family protein [Pseudobdellovibrio exovorus]|uniref:DedA family protein n=1 Tax=Pseudobdellovibrio exovorus JSS TaxID=1184267 RepID=M4VR54_9BACT|nr:hypothetical protein [Pseudobdellovibrio exovorus]AGH95654.1 hypothetical protein A11Q_1438 [Pseudobdellovibrio exovorus JSS]